MRNRISLGYCLLAIATTGCGARGTAGSSTPPLVARPPASLQNSRMSLAVTPVCPGATTVAGIDVWDEDPGTNWATVQKGGVGFTFIKATEGLTIANVLFPTDWPAAKAGGVLRGAYHFFHPDDDPTKQAQFFLNTMGPLLSGDLPPVLDWEVTDGIASSQQIQDALIWLQVVQKATGKTPIIYTYPSFWTALGSPSAFSAYPLWMSNTEVKCPDIPGPWTNWVFWQYATAAVSGTSPDSGVVDVDVFNGTFTQLQQFALTGTF